ncbi:hypothetical protein AB1L88_25040 [Tautonia sp. JC769]|uniref:hypothetical protein n=1 Tax=Tautonia sp. JC769 TaxID=3232135 RepID=UPI0034587F53
MRRLIPRGVPMSSWRRGDLVELDGLLAVVVGVAGDRNVSEGHVAVWFGDPRGVRTSEGGPGGRRPEVVTVPAEFLVAAAEPVWHH